MLPSDVKLIFSRVLCRSASDVEAQGWAAISLVTSDPFVQTAISQLPPEALQFVDPVIRLYQGAFSRVPDTTNPPEGSGFYTWVNYLRTSNISALSAVFVTSPEFLALYGSDLVTAAMITALYFNVLQREPTTDEVNSILVLHLDAATLLSDFTESPEFKTNSLSHVNAFKAALIAGHNPTGTLFSFH